MPKFPGLSGAQIVRALERLGFVVARQSGSHIVMRRNGQGGYGQRCAAPSRRQRRRI